MSDILAQLQDIVDNAPIGGDRIVYRDEDFLYRHEVGDDKVYVIDEHSQETIDSFKYNAFPPEQFGHMEFDEMCDYWKENQCND